MNYPDGCTAAHIDALCPYDPRDVLTRADFARIDRVVIRLMREHCDENAVRDRVTDAVIAKEYT